MFSYDGTVHISESPSSHWFFFFLLAVFYFGQTGMPVCPGLRQHRWVGKADAPSTGKQAAVAGPTDSLWTTWRDALSGLMPGSFSLNIECSHCPASIHPLTHYITISLFLPLLFLFNKHADVLCYVNQHTKYRLIICCVIRVLISAQMLLQVRCYLLRYVRRFWADWSVTGSWVLVPPLCCHHVWRGGLLDWLAD